MTNNARIAVTWSVPTAIIMGFFGIMAGSGMAPWHMMTRSEAVGSDQAIMERLERHEQRMSEKMDRLAETLAKVVGSFEAHTDKEHGI